MKILATLLFFIIPALGYAESSTTSSQVGKQPDIELATNLPSDVGYQDYANSPPAAPESMGTYYDFWQPKSASTGKSGYYDYSAPTSASGYNYNYSSPGTSAPDYYTGSDTSSYYDYSAPKTGSSAPDAPDYKIADVASISGMAPSAPPPISANCLLDSNGQTELTRLKTTIAALLKDKAEQFKGYLKGSIERCPKANLGYHRKVHKSLDTSKPSEGEN